MTEAEARAALRAFGDVGQVEPWIAGRPAGAGDLARARRAEAAGRAGDAAALLSGS